MKPIRWLNLLTFVGVVTVNALANALPINGITTGDVSAMYDNYFTPAGFTFSIWGLIYLSLLFLIIYQLKDRASGAGTTLDDSLGYWLVLNFVANMAWIYAWHYGQFTFTLLLMLVILSTLVVVNIKTTGFGWVVRFPLQLYLGWICVATIANFAVWLTYKGWGGFGLAGWQWGLTMVLVAAVVALVLLLWQGYVISALTIAWGVYGIYGKQVASSTGVALLASVCLGVVIFLVIATAGKVGRGLIKA